MRYGSRQSFGLVGTLFVSACCLGAAPLVVAVAAAVGLGAVSHALNIYVLGPLMTLSILWIAWNLAVQGRAFVNVVAVTPYFNFVNCRAESLNIPLE